MTNAFHYAAAASIHVLLPLSQDQPNCISPQGESQNAPLPECKDSNPRHFQSKASCLTEHETKRETRTDLVVARLPKSELQEQASILTSYAAGLIKYERHAVDPDGPAVKRALTLFLLYN